MNYGRTNKEEILQFYYKFIFPADLIMRLFGNRRDRFGNAVEIRNREIAVRLDDGTGRASSRIMSRYHSNKFPNRLKSLLINNLPSCVFIGASYSHEPDTFKDQRAAIARGCVLPMESLPFYTMHHEFVIDIDLSDYDPVRTCCQHRDICQRCWRFMSVACQMIERVLAEDLGIKHRLWLFSGGRGIHCWCFDHINLTLDANQRDNIVEYIQSVFKPNDEGCLEAHLRHPSVLQAYQTALQYIPDILQEQNCLNKPFARDNLLDYLHHHLRENEDLILLGEIQKCLLQSSFEMESEISIRMYNLLQSLSKRSTAVAVVLQRIVQLIVFPRLDAPVTRDVTHLLRCPLSVHVNSGGRLVLPFRPEQVAGVLADADGVQRLPKLRYDDCVWGRDGWAEEDFVSNIDRYTDGKRIVEDMCEALKQEKFDVDVNLLGGSNNEQVPLREELYEEKTEQVHMNLQDNYEEIKDKNEEIMDANEDKKDKYEDKRFETENAAKGNNKDKMDISQDIQDDIVEGENNNEKIDYRKEIKENIQDKNENKRDSDEDNVNNNAEICVKETDLDNMYEKPTNLNEDIRDNKEGIDNKYETKRSTENTKNSEELKDNKEDEDIRDISEMIKYTEIDEGNDKNEDKNKEAKDRTEFVEDKIQIELGPNFKDCNEETIRSTVNLKLLENNTENEIVMVQEKTQLANNAEENGDEVVNKIEEKIYPPSSNIPRNTKTELSKSTKNNNMDMAMNEEVEIIDLDEYEEKSIGNLQETEYKSIRERIDIVAIDKTTNDVEVIDVDEYAKEKMIELMKIFDPSDDEPSSDDSDVQYVGTTCKTTTNSTV